jgi:amino acid transporter
VTETGLRRSVGVTGLFLYGLGDTLSAGIFMLVGKIAGVAGMQAPPPGVWPLPEWQPRLGALLSMGFISYSRWQFIRPA